MKSKLVFMPSHRHKISVPDVAYIRRLTGLSQKRFAAVYGFSASAVSTWEQGIRSPSLALRHYLTVIEKNPRYVSLAIRDAVTK